MALRPLRPKPPQEALGAGWDLVASEAGRSNSGLRATLMLLNGEVKDTQTLALGNKKQQRAFAADAAALSGLDPAVILAALPKLAYAIEALLRAMPPPRDSTQAPQAGQAFAWPAVAPWPEAVDGAALLADLAQVYTRYLVLPAGGSTVLALWTLHTYVFDVFDVSPYLTLTSPQKRCGKSTVLMVASALTHAPVLVSNATPAAMFRLIELVHPTLLVDEAETFVRENEDLRGILNSGHTKRTAYVLRTVGEEHEPRLFSTWTPKMLAGIGQLPETIRDRSLVLAMARKTRQERVAKWRERDVARYGDLCRRCVRWAADHREALAQAEPTVPELASDRAADNWATLLAIAEEAGGTWRQQTEAAINALTGASEEEDDDNMSLLLLADLRRFFVLSQAEQVASSPLVEWLGKREERPWTAYGKAGKPITQRQMARLLGLYQIRSRQLPRPLNVKGYFLAECQESFARYLPPLPGDGSEAAKQPNNDATTRDSRSEAQGGAASDRQTGFAASDQASFAASDRNPLWEEDAQFSFDPDDPIPF
jgi:putative DNA primase/helicase